MGTENKSFMLYKDQIDIIHMLSDEQAGKLIKMIFKYANNQDIVEDDLFLQLAFTPIKQQLDRDFEKYKETCKRNKANAEKRWNNEKDQKNQQKES